MVKIKWKMHRGHQRKLTCTTACHQHMNGIWTVTRVGRAVVICSMWILKNTLCCCTKEKWKACENIMLAVSQCWGKSRFFSWYMCYMLWNKIHSLISLKKICSKNIVYKVKIKIWFGINSRVYLQLDWEKTTNRFVGMESNHYVAIRTI